METKNACCSSRLAALYVGGLQARCPIHGWIRWSHALHSFSTTLAVIPGALYQVGELRREQEQAKSYQNVSHGTAILTTRTRTHTHTSHAVM